MSRTITALSVLLWLPAFGSASEDQPTTQQLQKKLESLKSRVAELEQQQQQPVADPREMANVIDQVVADAQRRSQLMFADETVTGGFDLAKTKFFIGSSDGNFLFAPGLFGQLRNTTNIDQASDDTNNGWEIRRLKILFEGHAFTPDLQYKVQWETSTNGGNVFLQDAWVRYRFAENWTAQLGQFKDIWYHEETVGDQLQLAAERSLLNALLGGGQTDRIQGLLITFDDKKHWRGQILFDDGYNSDNTGFSQGGGNNFTGVIPTNFGLSGRLEYFVQGSRRDYDNLNGAGMKQELLVFGAGSSFSQAGDSDVVFNSLDVQYQNGKNLILWGGLVGVYESIGNDEPLPPGDFFNWGFIAQGGYFFNEKLQVFARYDYTQVDDAQVPAGFSQDYSEVTVGFNYFFRKNAVRMVVDFTWLPDGSPINALGLGAFRGNDDQFIIRAQFQLFI